MLGARAQQLCLWQRKIPFTPTRGRANQRSQRTAFQNRYVLASMRTQEPEKFPRQFLVVSQKLHISTKNIPHTLPRVTFIAYTQTLIDQYFLFGSKVLFPYHSIYERGIGMEVVAIRKLFLS